MPEGSSLRIVSWNIRAGGGVRANAIVHALLAWAPDIVALDEIRATPPSAAILAALADAGLTHQWSGGNPRQTAYNAVAVASRFALRRYHTHNAPPGFPGRWFAAEMLPPDAPPVHVAAVHIPNEVTRRKFPYMAAVLEAARKWRARHAIIVGDTNSGRPVLDEESPVFGPRYTAWFDALESVGWRDSFRHLHPEAREFTWYSPNGRNGFRLDQAFVSRRLMPQVASVRHEWAMTEASPERRDAISDHAALIVDVTWP
jgi:exodeoxyribonuclease-3